MKYFALSALVTAFALGNAQAEASGTPAFDLVAPDGGAVAPGPLGLPAFEAPRTFASAGGWRFDAASVASTAAPVPEPTSAAAGLAGLAAVGFLARRRRAG